MTFEEAVKDPARPLSLTPREWMYSVEAKLAEENDLVEDAVKRIGAKKQAEDATPPAPTDSGTGMEKIDMGIDQMVQACQMIASGLRDARMADLQPEARKAVESIRDLLETAIEPYLADIIKYSDSLDAE